MLGAKKHLHVHRERAPVAVNIQSQRTGPLRLPWIAVCYRQVQSGSGPIDELRHLLQAGVQKCCAAASEELSRIYDLQHATSRAHLHQRHCVIGEGEDENGCWEVGVEKRGLCTLRFRSNAKALEGVSKVQL